MKSLTKKQIYLILVILMAIGFILQIIIEGFHSPGLYLLIGFGGSWLLILFSKKIIAPLLQKPEDYYEGGKEQ